jgi:phosphonate transport system substrate-binding protein
MGTKESHMMTRRLSRLLAIHAVCMLCLVPTSYAGETPEALTIAILPCSDTLQAFKKFHPLATYLKQETGFEIKIVVPKDVGEFERVMKTGNMDFAFQGPHTYVRLSEWFKKDALIRALTREGTATQAGVIIVRQDSPIKKIEDLRGRSVMFGPRLSATKWLAPKLLLEDNGINIDKDLLAYSNGGCCEDIAFSVYLKKVDAGVVCDHFMSNHSEKEDELGIESEQIVVIGKTRSVPTRVFAARRDLAMDIVTALNGALLRLNKKEPAHKYVLHHAELDGFQEAKDAEYDRMRMLIGVTKSQQKGSIEKVTLDWLDVPPSRLYHHKTCSSPSFSEHRVVSQA